MFQLNTKTELNGDIEMAFINYIVFNIALIGIQANKMGLLEAEYATMGCIILTTAVLSSAYHITLMPAQLLTVFTILSFNKQVNNGILWVVIYLISLGIQSGTILHKPRIV